MSIESYIGSLAISGFQSEAKLTKKGGAKSERKSGTRQLGVTEGETPAPPPSLPSNLKAAVNAGSILSFVDGVDERERSDVLFSTQFAQRAADAAHDRFAETRSWYRKLNEILEIVGWTNEQYAFQAHEQKEGNLRMDQEALGVITAIASGNQLATLTASIKALEKLAAKDKAITLFDHYAATDLSGNFQIGAVQKGDKGAISMAAGAFYFRSTGSRQKFLFFQWGAREVNFWTAAQKMTFNTAIYEKVRKTIEQRLGDEAMKVVSAIDIAI